MSVEFQSALQKAISELNRLESSLGIARARTAAAYKRAVKNAKFQEERLINQKANQKAKGMIMSGARHRTKFSRMIVNSIYMKVESNIVVSINFRKKDLCDGLTLSLVKNSLKEADVVVGSDVNKAIANLKKMLDKLDLLDRSI